MTENFYDDQNDNIRKLPAFNILVEESIHLPGKNHYCVTLENHNGCMVFVIGELTESNTNKQIIFPVNVHKNLLDIIHHFLSIRMETKDTIENKYVDKRYNRIIYTEDDSYYFYLHIEDENYYVTIIQMRYWRIVLITLDFSSLEAVEEAIKMFENNYDFFFHENDCGEYRPNLEIRFESTSEYSIGQSIFKTGDHGLGRNVYVENDLSQSAFIDSDLEN
ncbi:hypothetical protein RF11_08080 [Thelohanellus kitauei]|uniref:Uncharacterized protein n=1 Tax=Thelohanellus kitauei TaxID=669202 RepID=A0A0C2IEE1_THEKT|nr:hypothetical protein RF11_08080 [Thelohanellus kitauei]